MSNKNPDLITTEKRYPLLYKDKHIAATLKGFKEVLINYSKESRFNMSRKMLNMHKDTYEFKISKALKISRIVNSNKIFAEEFGVDLDKLEISLSANINYYNNEVKNKRANPHYIVYFYHQFIFFNLQRFGWGQTKQVNFMYDIYMECDYNGYYTNISNTKHEPMKEKVIKALKDNIRKSQEKAMKQLEPWDYGMEY